jgi:dipeptidyl aminopeptidase/acylaminoacyl peptidase
LAIIRLVAVRLAAIVALVSLPCLLWAEAFSATHMMDLKRVSDPQVSPDGTRIVFVLTKADLATNTKTADLWIVPASGGTPRPLTSSAASDSSPRFSPDGQRIAFISAREGPAQVFLLHLAGGEAWRATSFEGGVGTVSWIDDRRLLVGAEVFPACGADEECNAERLAALETPSKVRVYDNLLYRHWDTWDDGRRQHLFAVDLGAETATDLTPGPDDVPPFSLSAPEGFSVSPDGKEVCFSRKEARQEAWSTNGDVWVVASTGGQPERVTDGPGDEGGCRYSPDGRLMAWRMQEQDGYESDRWQLVVRDRSTGAQRNLTAGFDRQVDAFLFSPDSRDLYLVAADRGRNHVFKVPAAGGQVTEEEGESFYRVLGSYRGVSEAALAYAGAAADTDWTHWQEEKF